MDDVHKILYDIGVDEEEKAKLGAYHPKDVAHVLYKMWVDGQELGEVPITLDFLKNAFLE